MKGGAHGRSILILDTTVLLVSMCVHAVCKTVTKGDITDTFLTVNHWRKMGGW